MNIVNFQLAKEGMGFIPHMFLDYFAQRTSHELYEDIFSRYVTEFAFGTAARQESVSIGKVRDYYNNYLVFSGKK